MYERLLCVSEILVFLLILVACIHANRDTVDTEDDIQIVCETEQNIDDYDLSVIENDTELVSATYNDTEAIEEQPEEPEFIQPEIDESLFNEGFTNAAANIRKTPTLDGEVYTTYGFNSCIYYAPYNDQWDIVKYYDQATQEIVYAYIHDSLVSDTEFVFSEMEVKPSTFKNRGVVNWGGHRWTWYSERVLPGGGLHIPGRHLDDNGYVCDENERIVLASIDYAKGTILQTPFGKEGCVYDECPITGTVDVYVGW